jgi:hypothetical protein
LRIKIAYFVQSGLRVQGEAGSQNKRGAAAPYLFRGRPSRLSESVLMGRGLSGNMNGPEASPSLIKTLTDGMDHGKAVVGFVVTKWPGLAHRSVTMQTQSRATALRFTG